MGIVLCDSETALVYHIDVNRSDSLCMLHQGNGADTTDARPRAFKSVTARKANTYAAESAQVVAFGSSCAADGPRLTASHTTKRVTEEVPTPAAGTGGREQDIGKRSKPPLRTCDLGLLRPNSAQN